MNKLYNEKIFFNVKEQQNNEDYKNHIKKIINDVLNSEQLDMNNSYIPTLEEDYLSSSFGVIEKLKKQRSLKLNLNISNNYFNCYESIPREEDKNPSYLNLNYTTNATSSSERVNPIESERVTQIENKDRPNRFTVFLSKIY
jgi:hypothetical protein